MVRSVVALTAALLVLVTQSGAAQDPAKLTIRWYGQSMFQVETSLGKKIVFDPHAIPEFGRVPVAADIVTISHHHSDHTQLGVIENAKAARVFQGLEDAKKGKQADWKKNDEKVGMVRVRSVGLYHDADDGLVRGKNSAFVIEADGLTICHLGDLGHLLTEQQIKAIGPVDVVMVPVGGIYAINGEQARKVVAQLKPRLFVFPMHYGVPGYDELLGVDEFLDGPMAVKKLPATNEFAIPLDLKADAATVVVLGWTKPDAKKP